VLDLQIGSEKVTAVVAGSRRNPYHVEIAMNEMLKNSGKKTRRVIKDADVSELFGI